MKPQHKHDCNNCIFLGTYEDKDLYFCTQGMSIPTVTSRNSSDGADYISGLSFADPVFDMKDLFEAKMRAIEKGLLKPEKDDLPYLKIRSRKNKLKRITNEN